MQVRRIALGAFTAVAVAMTAGAVAFACVPSARLGLSTATGRPGDSLIVSGANFSVPVNATNPVQLRWNGLEGPLLAEVRPDPSGNFSLPVTVPDSAPGAYTVNALWMDEQGDTNNGMLTRAVFEILVPGTTATTAPFAAVEPEAVVPTPTPATSSSLPMGLVVGLGVLGLALFGGGLYAAGRSRRTQGTPAPVRRG
ncbi:MAG: hypothetical protein ACRD2W_24695 [Acidimicrobiales bacterium]